MGFTRSGGGLYLRTMPFFMAPVTSSLARAPERPKLAFVFSTGAEGDEEVPVPLSRFTPHSSPDFAENSSSGV